jgi:hypothetical protein
MISEQGAKDLPEQRGTYFIGTFSYRRVLWDSDI